MKTRVHTEERSAAELPTALAHDIATRLQAAIQDRGRALLVVSGGKSPVALFEALRMLPIAWHQVTITLADERCVPNTHADSNALLVRTHLLQDLASTARLVPMIADAMPLRSPAQMAAQATTSLRGLGDADVLVLGMGTDGHTASIFPGMAQWAQALDPNGRRACLPATTQTEPPAPPRRRHSRAMPSALAAGAQAPSIRPQWCRSGAARGRTGLARLHCLETSRHGSCDARHR